MTKRKTAMMIAGAFAALVIFTSFMFVVLHTLGCYYTTSGCH